LFTHSFENAVFGPCAHGYPAKVSGSGERALMQVEPTRLVELAAAAESTLSAMKKDWADAIEELSSACTTLGDAKGTTNVAASYADSLADASEVVTAIAQTLGVGISGLIEAAQDAVRADDTVASELDWAAHHLATGPLGAPIPGKGGR
jgi:ABC-type transporter Mla subunit MlaD